MTDPRHTRILAAIAKQVVQQHRAEDYQAQRLDLDRPQGRHEAEFIDFEISDAQLADLRTRLGHTPDWDWKMDERFQG